MKDYKFRYSRIFPGPTRVHIKRVYHYWRCWREDTLQWDAWMVSGCDDDWSMCPAATDWALCINISLYKPSIHLRSVYMYSSRSREYSYYFKILKLLRYMSQKIIFAFFVYIYTLCLIPSHSNLHAQSVSNESSLDMLNVDYKPLNRVRSLVLVK